MENWACDSELSRDFASHGAGPRAIGRSWAFAGSRGGRFGLRMCGIHLSLRSASDGALKLGVRRTKYGNVSRQIWHSWRNHQGNGRRRCSLARPPIKKSRKTFALAPATSVLVVDPLVLTGCRFTEDCRGRGQTTAVLRLLFLTLEL